MVIPVGSLLLFCGVLRVEQLDGSLQQQQGKESALSCKADHKSVYGHGILACPYTSVSTSTS